MLRPPALDKIWPWLLPDKGGVSCRYDGPSVRLMNGGFYLETARELQWRKECQVASEGRETLANVGRALQTLRWTHTVCMYMLQTYMRAHTHQQRQHLRVIQKLKQHRLHSSRHETKQRPGQSQYPHKHIQEISITQIIIRLFGQEHLNPVSAMCAPLYSAIIGIPHYLTHVACLNPQY